jgi:DeoR family fructose operon transcriptional repressor
MAPIIISDEYAGDDEIIELMNQFKESQAQFQTTLNMLEEKNYLRRSYGAVSLIEEQPPLIDRYKIMRKAKNLIAHEACRHIADGDTVFIDGSSTTEAMGKHLITKKNVTVITNNISLFLFLCENGVDAVILGGQKKEAPYLLGGRETEASALLYHADKTFFSAYSASESGYVSAEEEFETLRRIMIRNSKKSYFLINEDKLFHPFKRSLCDFGEISGVISDYAFSEELKSHYPETEFITV